MDCPKCKKAIDEDKIMVHIRKVHQLKAKESKKLLGRSSNLEDISNEMLIERGYSKFCTPSFVKKFMVR